MKKLGLASVIVTLALSIGQGASSSGGQQPAPQQPSAQQPAPAGQQPQPTPSGPPAQEQRPPVIRRGINYVSVDVIVTDSRGNPVLDLKPEDFELAEEGFVGLTMRKGSDNACFFSANSSQRPAEYDTREATMNSRINARLPYIFLASRIAHYLKVIQRENIGATKDRMKIEKELNTWIKSLIIGIKDPSEAQIAKYPLRDAQVKVYDIEENPGFYRVEMMIMPHFQIEGMDISLSLVGKMPKGK